MHKAGFVNIIGNPNVGKSTLMNAILGEQLSITSHKAQTTRHRIFGLYNEEDLQIVFSDTPGVIMPAYALQESMMDFVKNSLDDADVFLYMTEPGEKGLKDPVLFEKLQQVKQPLIVVINKIDLTNQDKLIELNEYWKGFFPNAEIYPISALNNFNTDMLLKRLKDLLPESPPYFDKENLSDKNDRFFVSEMIREQILLNYSKEIPYAVEVEVEEFKEAKDIIRMRATIITERDTQKGILIGHEGKMIKKTGTGARKRLEAFFKKKVYLDLSVKVRKNWRQNEEQLKKFGYKKN
tara:strand:+ start:1219 stop:2100 length:882 start_codon:yes stop_codon:yes gene_type:complete